MYIIAEIGANHQGSLSIAKGMVDELIGIGVHAVKTCKQSMKEAWKDMPYDSENSFGETYYDHRQALELTNDEFKELSDYVKSKGFDFIASFTDIESYEFLKHEVHPRYYKLPSSRNTDIELLDHIYDNQYKQVDDHFIVSTGMSDLETIKELSYKIDFEIILQCTSCYPCEKKDLNLNVIHALFNHFPACFVGFSGHHIGTTPDLYAYAMGAKVIERHYTFDKKARGTDHKISLYASEFKHLIERLKELDEMLGDGEKKILDCELPAIEKLRNDLGNH